MRRLPYLTLTFDLEQYSSANNEPLIILSNTWCAFSIKKPMADSGRTYHRERRESIPVRIQQRSFERDGREEIPRNENLRCEARVRNTSLSGYHKKKKQNREFEREKKEQMVPGRWFSKVFLDQLCFPQNI
ncbi:hypothetical protein R6Q59_024459 [Mikania micrantha]